MVRINTGLPPTGKKLFGNISPHTQPFASRNYNDMPVHSAIIILASILPPFPHRHISQQ